jgi:hypothetical protein
MSPRSKFQLPDFASREKSGGEGGILFHEVLKIPVLMVKTNPNHVKRYWG